MRDFRSTPPSVRLYRAAAHRPGPGSYGILICAARSSSPCSRSPRSTPLSASSPSHSTSAPSVRQASTKRARWRVPALAVWREPRCLREPRVVNLTSSRNSFMTLATRRTRAGPVPRLHPTRARQHPQRVPPARLAHCDTTRARPSSRDAAAAAMTRAHSERGRVSVHARAWLELRADPRARGRWVSVHEARDGKGRTGTASGLDNDCDVSSARYENREVYIPRA